MERGGVGPLAEDDRVAILAENDDMGAAGLRVLGMAFAERPAAEVDRQPTLCWLGLVGLADYDSTAHAGADRLLP